MTTTNGDLLRKDLKAQAVTMSNGLYDFAKDAATIYIPALVVAYSGLAIIWGWPLTDQVVASAGIVVTLLGAFLKLSSKQYAKAPVATDGVFVVNETNPEKDTYSLNVDNLTHEDIVGKDVLVLKVDKQS